jgi:hypothetical protein
MEQISPLSQSHAGGVDTVAVRPRTALELVDAAVVLGRRHFAPLLTLSALSLVANSPIYLSYVLLGDGVLPLGLPRIVADLYETVVSILFAGALVVATSDAYLGRGVDVAGSLRVSWRRAWPLVVSGLLLAALFFVGLLLLIAPGLYVLARAFAVTPAVVLEDRGVLDAFRRSAALSRGIGRKILATVGVGTLVFVAIMLAFMIMLQGWTGSEGSAAFLTLAVLVPATPFLYALVTLVYYDARIVREGYDVQLMAEALERHGGAPGR